jgi:hypothetical protein
MPLTSDASRLKSLPSFRELDPKRQDFVSLIVDKRLPKSKAAKLTGLNAAREMRNGKVAAVLAEFFVERKSKRPPEQRPEIPGATYVTRDNIRATGKTLNDLVLELEGYPIRGIATVQDEWSDQEWEQAALDARKRAEDWRLNQEKNLIYTARVQHRATRIHKSETHPEGCELCREDPL